MWADPTGGFMSDPSDKSSGVSRREFVSTIALTGAGLTIVPRHVLGRGLTAPSDLVNVAIVGIGGMGGSNAQALFGQNIVAVCDCDEALMLGKFQSWKNAVTPNAGGQST